jgi:hypothetical protein
MSSRLNRDDGAVWILLISSSFMSFGPVAAFACGEPETVLVVSDEPADPVYTLFFGSYWICFVQVYLYQVPARDGLSCRPVLDKT